MHAFDDQAFVKEILPHVSRTFTLSIEGLPLNLQEAVRVAYLLCRIVDTIEDTPSFSWDQRIALYDCFDQTLTDDGYTTHHLEELFKRYLDNASDWEKNLCHQSGAVFRIFRTLPFAQRQAIRPSVFEMSRGMRKYSERVTQDKALQLVDLEDLEQYCYYVAGTVGNLLTQLFLDSLDPVKIEDQASLKSHAVNFGLGLQLVNIVKDVVEDYKRGICFLPLKLAEENHLNLAGLLSEEQRTALRRVVKHLCQRARTHLDLAEAYTLQWPVPEGNAIRLFCTVPLALAFATLKEVENIGHDFHQQHAPKVSRATVVKIMMEANHDVGGNESLAALFHRYA